MSSFNKLILVGNLGRDPELRYTPQGTPVCSFSIATNERRKNRNGDQADITTWFRATLWGKQAETAAQYLTKGRPVYLEGRLRIEKYNDKDGVERQSNELHVTEMQFISNGNGNGAAAASATSGGAAVPQADAEPDLTDDDLPF